jgi:hypothetical protein
MKVTPHFIRIKFRPERCILQGSFCGALHGEGHQFRRGRKRFDRIAQLQPAIQPAQQRPNFFISFTVQEPRHPGAGGFVRSSAIHHHRLAQRDFLVPRLKFFGGNVDGSWNFRPFRLVTEVGPQIDNDDILSAGQHFL